MRDRLLQILLLAILMWLSWLLMMLVHETGHLFGAKLTGGTVQFMQGYDGRTGQGLPGFVARARELASTYGDRFAPTDRLVEMAEKGESFPA